ncbi:hypothetical protein QFC19_001076 [Naganishia cerealis]|uniref:Uncharacterized protein n=1 Tax=Naganishia cerealis TaxID=610337 RepID=A0ACC2WLL6_9TREE|nr:hypothetical protein QFC19_001076 [Naganishia cerealis]
MASTVTTPQAQALYQNHHSQSSESSNSVQGGAFAKEEGNHPPSLITESTYSIDAESKNNGQADELHDGSGNGDVDMRKRQRVQYTEAEEDEHKERTNLSHIPAELIHLTLLNLLPMPTEHDTQTLSIDPRPNPTPASELRRSLANLSKVNKVFHEQVKPLLWKDVKVEHGRGWMGVVEGLVPQSQYSEHHGHLHPHGHAQAPDVSLIENHSPHLAAAAHINEAHPHASPCIPAEPLPMLLPEEVSNHVPLRPNELTFSVAVAPVPEPVACGSCGIDMPQGSVSLSIGNLSAPAEGSQSANGMGLGLDTGVALGRMSAAPMSPLIPVEGPAAANVAATCNSCTNSPPQQVRAQLESPPLVSAQGSTHRVASPRRPSFATLPAMNAAHVHRHMPDTPHSTPTVATPFVNVDNNSEGPAAPPSTVSSRPIVSIPQRMNPYLPSLLTPPSSRRPSPARWTRASSGSRSRSRSKSQSQLRGRSPSPPPAEALNCGGLWGSAKPGLTRAPSGLRRSLSPNGPTGGSGFMRRRMSGSRMRSTSPIDGVAVPLPSINDAEVEVEGKGKGVAHGNKPSLGRRVSIRRGRGTDIGFAGYEHATFTAGIMQRLEALHPTDAAMTDLDVAAPHQTEGSQEDYFNYHDRESDPARGIAAEETLQMQELKRALDVEAAHQHEQMDGVVSEIPLLLDGETMGKEGVLQPDVAQEEVEGAWFDGVATEQEVAPTRPPIPQVRTLSFASFRTTGTLRTQEEAVRGKFVTPTRLLNVLRQVPRLKSLAMTEYVDSSLVKSVLEELFFRGYTKPADAPRRLASMSENGDMLDEHFLFEQEEWNRRETFDCIEAIDFTGCVSRVFSESLQVFVDDWLTEPAAPQPTTEHSVEDDDRRGRSRDVRDITVAHELAHGELAVSSVEGATSTWKKPMFTGLKRLSLRGCVTLSSDTIARLISCCPNLTHLDLSFTRVAPSTLEALSSMSTVRLEALSLARSTRLTGDSIRDFLITAPAAATIVDLNLFGDATYTSPLNALDLEAIITAAPCFRNKQLRYLDLSSTPVTSDMLDLFPPQPHLRSLGFSFIPFLELDAVATLLRHQTPNVEILTLTSSSTRVDLPPNLSALQTTMVLHQKLINPLTMAPFSIIPRPDAKIVSRLRILELSETVRKALGPTGGSRDWKVVKSKGGRGWYVDVSAGWLEKTDQADTRTCRPVVGLPDDDGSSPDDTLVYTRGLTQDHPWRQYLSSLADASGKVGSAVGWHSRKMEVVHGHGMLGREEGLYGAGAFAFEG